MRFALKDLVPPCRLDPSRMPAAGDCGRSPSNRSPSNALAQTGEAITTRSRSTSFDARFSEWRKRNGTQAPAPLSHLDFRHGDRRPSRDVDQKPVRARSVDNRQRPFEVERRERANDFSAPDMHSILFQCPTDFEARRASCVDERRSATCGPRNVDPVKKERDSVSRSTTGSLSDESKASVSSSRCPNVREPGPGPARTRSVSASPCSSPPASVRSCLSQREDKSADPVRRISPRPSEKSMNTKSKFDPDLRVAIGTPLATASPLAPMQRTPGGVPKPIRPANASSQKFGKDLCGMRAAGDYGFCRPGCLPSNAPLPSEGIMDADAISATATPQSAMLENEGSRSSRFKDVRLGLTLDALSHNSAAEARWAATEFKGAPSEFSSAGRPSNLEKPWEARPRFSAVRRPIGSISGRPRSLDERSPQRSHSPAALRQRSRLDPAAVAGFAGRGQRPPRDAWLRPSAAANFRRLRPASASPDFFRELLPASIVVSADLLAVGESIASALDRPGAIQLATGSVPSLANAQQRGPSPLAPMQRTEGGAPLPIRP